TPRAARARSDWLGTRSRSASRGGRQFRCLRFGAPSRGRSPRRRPRPRRRPPPRRPTCRRRSRSSAAGRRVETASAPVAGPRATTARRLAPPDSPSGRMRTSPPRARAFRRPSSERRWCPSRPRPESTTRGRGGRCPEPSGPRGHRGEVRVRLAELHVRLVFADPELLQLRHQSLADEAVEVVLRLPYVDESQSVLEPGNVEDRALGDVVLPPDG